MDDKSAWLLLNPLEQSHKKEQSLNLDKRVSLDIFSFILEFSYEGPYLEVVLYYSEVEAELRVRLRCR